MENVMTKGFCELSEKEMMDLDGGVVPLAIPIIGAIVGVTGMYIGVRKYVGDEGRAAGQDAFRQDYLNGRYRG